VHLLKTENLTNLVPSEMNPLLHELFDVFAPPLGMPPSKTIEDTIDLIRRDYFPNTPSYFLAPREAHEEEKQMNIFLDKGHIQPNCSPCASPKFIISKESDAWLLVINY